MLNKFKKRWDIKSNIQVIIILLVFAITGISVLYIKKEVFELIGFDSETPGWIKIPAYILVIFPAYQILLLATGFIFGQFRLFWKFEKKLLSHLNFTKRKNKKENV